MHVDELLRRMADLGASDLYIKVPAPPTYKVSGKVERADLPPVTAEMAERLVEQTLSERDRRIFDEKLQVDCSYVVDGVGRFRCNAYRQRDTVGMVFRRINTEIPTLDDLAVPESVRELCMAKRGLVLLTGATGCGKSTTLAAMIDWRNRHSAGHIVTIEDPIEYLHPDHGCIVSQREVGVDVDSYEDALKAALRQAPDVLLIGEIRTAEGAEAGLHLAETGHLVLSTLHSTNANQTIERLMQFFPAERHTEIFSQLAFNLRGVVSQRLLRGTDGKYQMVAEVMLGSPRIAELLRNGQVDQLKTTIAQSTREGMQTFDQAIHELWEAGKIDEETALAGADSRNDLKLRMRGFVAVGN